MDVRAREVAAVRAGSRLFHGDGPNEREVGTVLGSGGFERADVQGVRVDREEENECGEESHSSFTCRRSILDVAP